MSGATGLHAWVLPMWNSVLTVSFYNLYNNIHIQFYTLFEDFHDSTCWHCTRNRYMHRRTFIEQITTMIIFYHTLVKVYKSLSYLRHGGCRLLNIYECLCDEAKLKQSKFRWRDDLFNSSIGIYNWISLKGLVNEVHDFELPLLLQYTN